MDTLDEALDKWADWMKAANRSPDTIALRHWHVRHVLAGVGGAEAPWSVTEDQLVAWLDSGARES